MLRSDRLNARLEPRLSAGNGWQGFQVIEISKNYSLRHDQIEEWESLVRAKYPHVRGPGIQLKSDKNIIAYSKSRNGGYIYARAPEDKGSTTEKLMEHPLCPKEKVEL